MSSEMLRVDNLRQRLFCNTVLDAKRESRCPVCNAVFSTTYSMRLHLQTVHMDLEPQNLSAKMFYREFNNNNNTNNNNNINNHNNNNINNNSSFIVKSSPAKMFVNNNNCSPERAQVTPVKSALYNGDSACSTDFSDGYPSDKDSCFGNSPKDDAPLSAVCGSVASSHSSPTFKRSASNNNNHHNVHHLHHNHVKAKRTYTCRLCSTVFGNLRALKGHNSSSHNKSTNGLYACNICEFASTEKASLNHHMKGHTGETPYVCKKCSYAFTTKANCERHLRTIHKASNAEVKMSILFKNEEKSSSAMQQQQQPQQQQQQQQHQHQQPPINDEIATDRDYRRRTAAGHETATAASMMLMMDCSQYGSSGGHKSSAEDDDEEYEYDEPLDLSVKRFKPDPDCEPQDLSVNGGKRSDNWLTDEEDVKPSFREQFVPQGPPGYMDLNIPTPLHAYFLNEHRMFFNGIYPTAERMLPIPLTVDMIRAMRQMNEPSPLPPPPPQQKSPPVRQQSPVAEADPLSLPASVECKSPEPVAIVPPTATADVVSQKPTKDTNGLRLVMKNGILVPKQRRFRTDRPHVCETCKRAFTLKSNRDRHVKNQHPTDWHKKPRSLSKSEPQFSANVKLEQDMAPISDQVKMALSLKCRQPDQPQQRTEDEDEDEEDVVEEDKLIIVEDCSGSGDNNKPATEGKEESVDLASVSRLLDNASQQTFPQFTRSDEDHNEATSSEEEQSEGASYSENDGSG